MKKQHNWKNWDALTKKEREVILTEKITDVIAETHAAGRPTTHGDEKGIYKLYPDGRKEYID